MTTPLQRWIARLVLAVLLGGIVLSNGLGITLVSFVGDDGPALLVSGEDTKDAFDGFSGDLASVETAEFVPEHQFAPVPATPEKFSRRGDYIDLHQTGPPRA